VILINDSSDSEDLPVKIIVLVKQVPDTWGARTLDLTTGQLNRGASEAVIDEIGERATEVALTLKDADKSVEVVVLTMGPEDAADALRKGLAMGADSAVHVVDDALSGSDLAWTASVIAAAITHEGFDLVIAGNESTDGRGGVLPAMIAEHLGLPHLTYLNTVEVSGGEVKGERNTGTGSAEVHATLPAVVSVTERSAEPRFPNFKGIMSAKKKPLTVVSLADLTADAASGRSIVLSTKERPAREAGTKIVDDGTAGTQLADYLASNRLI
jgi:electron transfer flavoprotein beta subunit